MYDNLADINRCWTTPRAEVDECKTEQKRTQKQRYKMHPLYHKHKPLSCLFTFGNKNKTCTLQLCKRQSANNNVLIGKTADNWQSVHL